MHDVTFLIKTLERQECFRWCVRSISSQHPGALLVVVNDSLKPYAWELAIGEFVGCVCIPEAADRRVFAEVPNQRGCPAAMQAAEEYRLVIDVHHQNASPRLSLVASASGHPRRRPRVTLRRLAAER